MLFIAFAPKVLLYIIPFFSLYFLLNQCQRYNINKKNVTFQLSHQVTIRVISIVPNKKCSWKALVVIGSPKLVCKVNAIQSLLAKFLVCILTLVDKKRCSLDQCCCQSLTMDFPLQSPRFVFFYH